MDEVVKLVSWTDSAKISFNEAVTYLQEHWTEREVAKFIQRSNQVIATLKRYPEICRPSLKRKYVRIAIINKYTQMVYYYKPGNQQIEILLFWNTKRNPSKFPF